jgi:hypothetical protein
MVELRIAPTVPALIDYAILTVGVILGVCTVVPNSTWPASRWLLLGRLNDIYSFITAAIILYTLEPVWGDFKLSNFHVDVYPLVGIGIMNVLTAVALWQLIGWRTPMPFASIVAVCSLTISTLILANEPMAAGIVFYSSVLALGVARGMELTRSN